ncbi:MAG: CopG family transcriptional regulator [Acidobacteriota bacterium]
MVRLQVQLTEAEFGGLKRLASERSVSAAALVREAVDELLRSRRRPRRDELRQRASKALDRFHSGRGDISERHDEYFVEAIGG